MDSSDDRIPCHVCGRLFGLPHPPTTIQHTYKECAIISAAEIRHLKVEATTSKAKIRYHEEVGAQVQAELHKLRGSAERMKAVVEKAKKVYALHKEVVKEPGLSSPQVMFQSAVKDLWLELDALKALETGEPA